MGRGGRGRAVRVETRETAEGGGARLEVMRLTMFSAISEIVIVADNCHAGRHSGIFGREKAATARVGLAIFSALAPTTATAFSGPGLITGSSGRRAREDERPTAVIVSSAAVAKSRKRS